VPIVHVIVHVCILVRGGELRGTIVIVHGFIINWVWTITSVVTF
jgi:hypothetical protein